MRSLKRTDLVSSVDMARFVATGIVRLDGVVPAELNRRALTQLEAGLAPFPYGTPLADVHPPRSPLGAVLGLPAVAGAIQSLVGPGPTADHQFVHVRAPHEGEAQPLHADAVIDARTDVFDVQMMYYPEAVTVDAGGTVLVPGSHFRRVSHMDVARYQNVVGQERVVCAAGTVIFLHHAIWHAGGRNDSERRRVMYKLRLNPAVRQLRLWNTDDIDEPDVTATLLREPAWAGNDGRLEQVNRARLWRYLTGDDEFDLDFYLTRNALRPEVVSATATDTRVAKSARGAGFGVVQAAT
jgi:hypothetical protein